MKAFGKAMEAYSYWFQLALGSVMDNYPVSAEELILEQCSIEVVDLYKEEVFYLQKRVIEDFDLDWVLVKNLHKVVVSTFLSKLKNSRRMIV